MPGGRKPYRKGTRVEREIAKKLGAKRVPLSGASTIKGDLIHPILGTGEVKARANGFKQIYSWLEGRDFLIIKSDFKEPLIILRAKDMLRLIKPGPESPGFF